MIYSILMALSWMFVAGEAHNVSMRTQVVYSSWTHIHWYIESTDNKLDKMFLEQWDDLESNKKLVLHELGHYFCLRIDDHSERCANSLSKQLDKYIKRKTRINK